MKKIMMAVAVLISVAAGARAEEAMDFDGKFKPQTMHDIFANSHQLIPAPTPVPVETKLNPLGSACALVCVGQRLTDDCRCEPFYSWQDQNSPEVWTWPEDNSPIDWNSIQQYMQSGNNNYCVPVASGPWWMGCVVGGAPVKLSVAVEIPGRRAFMEMSAEQKKQLTIYYMLQGDLKKAVIARSAEYNFTPEIVAFVSDVKTKVLYDSRKVYITNGRMLLVINDDNLIAATKGQQKSAASVIAAAAADSAVTGNVIAGGALLIGCMVSDPCWNAVGDGVSDASEWAHNGTHWWN